MELKPVTQDDAEYLYELLKQREGSVNISHRLTPESVSYTHLTLPPKA